MSLLLIDYDLDEPGQRYEDLRDAIKGLSGTHWNFLKSSWFVKTGLTAGEVRDRLKTHLDSGDKLMVMNVTADAWSAWGFSKSGYDWLRTHGDG